MSSFVIRIAAANYVASAEVERSSTAEHALAEAVRSAVEIIADDLRQGQDISPIEVIVENQQNVPLLRAALKLSVVPLSVGPTIAS
ncbi:DUF6894 family protein [Sphingomonas sp. ac-8]|uniref:DUF6894 family protein n=1 Tax=Sphingomonas sp. ac-8 TaxID=3242977 RepID=UPI003A810880